MLLIPFWKQKNINIETSDLPKTVQQIDHKVHLNRTTQEISFVYCHQCFRSWPVYPFLGMTLDNVSELGNCRWIRRILTETSRRRKTRKETEAEKGRPPQCGLKHHIATDVHHPLTGKGGHWKHLGISLDKDDGEAGAGMRGVDPKRARTLDPISWPLISFLYNLSTLTSQLL